jgi:hypothetical protein
MSNYAMLDEAWSEPLMIQNNVGIFTENNTEKYQRGSYQRFFNNVPDFKKYNFESKPSVIKNKLPSDNNNNNNIDINQDIEDYNLTQKKEEVKKVIVKEESEEKTKCNPEDDPRFQELQRYVKDLESEIKGLKIEKMKKSQSMFGNVNSNEMIIFISFGVLIIMVLDSFSRLGAKLSKK